MTAVPQKTPKGGVFAPALMRAALKAAFVKLDPRFMVRSPVMFVVLLGGVLTLLLTVQAAASGQAWGYPAGVTLLLLFTVVFANFAEGLAEARGKAQAATLRSAREDTPARRVLDGREEVIPSTQLRRGDVIVVQAGEMIPGDGEVVGGLAAVDESAITGESAPVIREAGTDHSGVTGGTRVLSDRIVVRVTSQPGESFLDRMIALVEGASRQKTPNELALSILLAALTLVFLIVVATLLPLSRFAGATVDVVTLVALLVCLIPTTIGGLLPAIGIAGMDRALQANVIAKSGKAVEVAGDVDILLLDKTGTITVGDRQATRFLPLPGVSGEELAGTAALASAADPTPEGKSIVTLARTQGVTPATPADAAFIEFTAQTRMSGVDAGGVSIRKGAADRITRLARERGGSVPAELSPLVDEVARAGGTPLVVLRDERVLGVVALSDVVKPGMRERFEQLRRMGLRTVMITGDNPLTAEAIAREAGVDGFLAEATPEDKLAMIREEQRGGKLVAMMGDGTNDAPALAQADVGLAMQSGTQAAKEAANMIDLDSDPTKLIEVVEIGKGLLMTRGALTTFSIANDVAKYFAILPALFATQIPALAPLNVMDLRSPQSAILSAVIFNALVIPALIPVALRGVRYSPGSADALLARNLLIYGLGGVLVPFVGIKLIDVLLGLVGA
ncbi:potassium-transporting ATPase subunit KdpB [Deinococcus soli (ex Cha et al. 2016)]|uniref:K+-transporting ATPase ATPase B chain n=2 Tax=Deinococcus soli (ex Cha et al. 2016) TaxID=1309411 RepID=A0ACC6KKF6_9DEIO|nr:potassium-transporting ATPase subunit KdpB [Deinococcus soli (ex Cha et al. 2016)]MDR6220287.1 K+-transporting ATPase ATPase B chain [Deinococcus soli (ex Cha et al. 2016)]MDR6330142.1 K+-transporting ATPase ATPase B chain [Deinococcus soli (ex Cha et al. 2016)]MDR6752905.1 K+-transporting ATPase ATPase B chain [Deinococcus soli (ex Cha et al. 2016)]